jgi:hypothetical protein
LTSAVICLTTKPSVPVSTVQLAAAEAGAAVVVVGTGAAFARWRSDQETGQHHDKPDGERGDAGRFDVIGRCGERAAAGDHAGERRVAVDDCVLECARDVQDQRADQDLGGETVDAAKGLGQIRRFRHEGQRLTEGPQDRREAGGGGVGDPA